MTRILGVNGILSDGSESIDILLKELSAFGHTSVDAVYPKTHLFRFQTYDKGRQYQDADTIIKNYYTSNMVVVAHSRGCLVVWRMMEVGCRFKSVFLFRPAMNRDFSLPLDQVNVVCVFSPYDRAIKWGGKLPFNDFGNAGRYGLDDPRVINIKAPKYENSEFWKHSDDFLYPQVKIWASWINDYMKHTENKEFQGCVLLPKFY